MDETTYTSGWECHRHKGGKLGAGETEKSRIVVDNPPGHWFVLCKSIGRNEDQSCAYTKLELL